MAIIKNAPEKLYAKGNKNCLDLNEYLTKAQDMKKRWEDTTIPSFTGGFPVSLTSDAKAVYKGKRQDMSELAFSQLCSTVGLPAAYIRKCLESGREELALQNYFSWAGDRGNRNNRGCMIRAYNDVVEGIVTPDYNVFDADEIIENLADTLDQTGMGNRYSLNQVYMSPSKLHMRFVDFDTPVYTEDGGKKMYTGFTVSSSSVGAGSFNIKYFLYRYVCMNGLVIIRNGGTIYRQTHLSKFEETKRYAIAAALEKVDEMNGTAVQILSQAEHKYLSMEEMEEILNKARKELHMGRETSGEMMALREILNTEYPQRTLLSIANAVTENAQKYDSLDKRIEHETWAGNLLMAA